MKVKKKLEDGTEIEVEEEPEGGTTDPDPNAGGSKGGKTDPPTGYVTEESYKGLQRANEKQKVKLENELKALQERLTAQATELEEAKLAVAEKTTLEKAQQDLNTNIQTLTSERDKLNRQLTQQSIVLAEFSDLAPLASYIPTADTDENFRDNAKKFQTALQTYLKFAVHTKVEGASPAIEGGNGSAEQKEIDKLWAVIDATAGVSGKEAEYAEANAKLQEALKPKK